MPTIDADAHVIECEQTWSYIGNEKLRPFLISPGGGRPQNWLVDGRVFNRGVNLDRHLPLNICEMRDIKGRLKHMDELGIDLQILYPSLFLRPLTAKAEVENAICRSYNRWLIDICAKSEGRLRWVAVVPVIDIERAVEEINFAKANGACGVFMRGLIDDKRLSHPYFPLYQAAQTAELPICVRLHRQFRLGAAIRRRKRLYALQGARALGVSRHCSRWRSETISQLKFGFIEVRAQWVPYMAVEIARRFDRAIPP